MPDHDQTRTQSNPEDQLTRSRSLEDGATLDRPVTDATADVTTPIATPTSQPEIPGYTNLEVIGQGGMGMVYRGLQIKLNRTVAIKTIISRHVDDARLLVRFLAEAEAVGTLDHPHVLRVYDSGNVGPMPYLVMEYLPGGTLADRLKDNNALPTREAADLLRKIALGVAAAHDNQIVHRDLKPANVMFDTAGEPKVTDFGLAKKLGGSDLTATQAIMGTPAYMSPEQASGGAKFVGPAADVWALGVMLFECLSGRRPFEGADALEILQRVAEGEASSVRSVNRTIPWELELIVQKCLQKEPTDRYLTAKELANDLGNWLAGKPISVKPAGSVERVAKWMRRNKIASGIMAASLLAAITMSGLAIWAIREGQRADEQTQAAKNETRRADAEAENSRIQANQLVIQLKESRRLLDLGRLREAEADYERNAVQSALDKLAAIDPTNRCLAWGMLRRRVEGSDLTLSGHLGPVTSVAFSPDGRRVLTGSHDKTARIWDAISGQELFSLQGHRNWVTSVAFSPDGRQIATASHDKTARIWDATSGEQILKLEGHTSWISTVAFNPEGNRIVTASEDNSARVWDLISGQAVFTIKGHIGRLDGAGYSPDGQRIVTCSFDGTARVWDSSTGQTLLGLMHHAGWVTSSLFSPDGRRIITGSIDHTARVWNADDSRPSVDLKGHRETVLSVGFSPDGQKVATGSSDKTIRIWNIETGQTLVELKGHHDAVKSVAFSPDGFRLISGSEDCTARIWNTSTSQSPIELVGHINLGADVGFSSDGQKLVTGSYDKTARVWDTNNWQCLSVLSGHTEAVWSVMFSPDGRHIVTGSPDMTARVWDATSGRCIHELKGHTGIIHNVAYSSDGRCVVTASGDGTAIVWDASTGMPLAQLKGHREGLSCVAISLDSKMIATGSLDCSVRIWDAATGKCLLVLQGHQGQRILNSGSCAS